MNELKEKKTLNFLCHYLWQGVSGGWVVRRRHQRRQVVLQRLAEHGVEGHVRPHDVLLDPHVGAEALHLLPQAVQILQGKRTWNSFNSES